MTMQEITVRETTAVAAVGADLEMEEKKDGASTEKKIIHQDVNVSAHLIAAELEKKMSGAHVTVNIRDQMHTARGSEKKFRSHDIIGKKKNTDPILHAV